MDPQENIEEGLAHTAVGLGATIHENQPEEDNNRRVFGYRGRPSKYDCDCEVEDEETLSVSPNTIRAFDANKEYSSNVFEVGSAKYNQEQVRPSVRLATDKKALSLSLNAIRFAVFADAVTSTILDPNFPFMARPGTHPDSFESTEPFGFSAATYFLAMTALLGMAIASTAIGALSDRVGRKPCILACLAIGAVGAITNYLARKSFWGFCASNFAQGLFAASLPVAMAYVSDVKRTRKEKDAEIGVLVALNMLGMTGGGIAAILMESQGLFSPLFVGAAINTVATFLCVYWVIEPNKMLFEDAESLSSSEDEAAPKTIDHRLLGNIVVGALFDNIGSAGLIPIAMSPLAFTEFFTNFVEVGLEPIMSQSAFKWIFVMVALTVIPGAGISQVIFDRIGAAAGCVIGNVVTGLVTIAVLFIAYLEPATKGTFAAFIVVLYVGFPFTVISQLSTGPMLDTIAPADRRGYVQGLNVSVMAFATAVSPYLLGEMADNIGTGTTMWVCVGISFAAAAINVPLMFSKVLRAARKKAIPDFARPLLGEDADIVERALEGKWVPAEELETLNDKRMKNGQPFLVIPYKEYKEEKEHLSVMRKQAKADFLYLRHMVYSYLSDEEFKSEEKRQELVEQFTAARPSQEQKEELAKGLGKWFADYVMDNGYWIDDSPILYKQMIMQAFPPINSDGDHLTADNLEQVAVNYTRVLNQYLDENDVDGATKAFARRFVVE